MVAGCPRTNFLFTTWTHATVSHRALFNAAKTDCHGAGDMAIFFSATKNSWSVSMLVPATSFVVENFSKIMLLLAVLLLVLLR